MLIGFKIIGSAAFYSFLTKPFLPLVDCNLIFGLFTFFFSFLRFEIGFANLLFSFALRIEFFIEHRFSASIINCFLKAVEFALRIGF